MEESALDLTSGECAAGLVSQGIRAKTAPTTISPAAKAIDPADIGRGASSQTASAPATNTPSAAQKGHRALQRVAAQQPVEVVGQRVVDGGFDLAVEGEHAL